MARYWYKPSIMWGRHILSNWDKPDSLWLLCSKKAIKCIIVHPTAKLLYDQRLLLHHIAPLLFWGNDVWQSKNVSCVVLELWSFTVAYSLIISVKVIPRTCMPKRHTNWIECLVSNIEMSNLCQVFLTLSLTDANTGGIHLDRTQLKFGFWNTWEEHMAL